MSIDDAPKEVTSATSEVWSHLVPVPGTPEGFTARTTYPTNRDGVEVMLERWQAGTEEPPHFHPGDDMTVVVEGRMAVQFYRKEAHAWVPDGERIVLDKGDVGYIRARRVHDASYIEACRLVYVHNGAFAFHLASDEDPSAVRETTSHEAQMLDALDSAQAPLCDDCVTAVVGWDKRQQASSVGATMAERDAIVRAHGVCSRCGRRKIVNGLPLAPVRHAVPRGTGSR